MKIISFLLVFLGFTCFANDTLKVFKYNSYIQQVMLNHPYAQNAHTVQEVGKSNLTKARGGFDPKVVGDLTQKYFDDKQYYSRLNGALKIPSWFGLTAETGYVMNEGTYLNSEMKVPSNGLWYAGLKLEVGKGLLIDKRRVTLKKAHLFKSSTELQRVVMLNDLKRNASIAYWKWQQVYQELNVYKLAYKNAGQRLSAIKDAVVFGEKSSVDTVEASIVVQKWELSLLKVENSYKNAELNLENYLWSDGFVPLEISNAIPENVMSNIATFQDVQIDSLITNHPTLKINDLNIKEKRVDLRMKREQLKPQITLKYNALSQSVNDNPFQNYSIENYNWGIDFSYPIFTREERGGVQLAKLKLQEQERKNDLKLAQVKYKVNSSVNNYNRVLKQLVISEKLALNAEALYRAEKSLFKMGESSVFLINYRENTWLKSRIELIKFQNESNTLKSNLLFELMINHYKT
jgi:outer membrane protein TolC